MEVGAPNKVDRLEAAFADHEDGNLFVQLADAYREAGDHERALNVLRKGLEKHASYLPGYVLLGRILVEQGRFPEALVTYERVLEIDAANADARAALDVIMAQLRTASVAVAVAGAGAGTVRDAGAEPRAAVEAPPEPPSLTEAAADVMPWDEPAPRNGTARAQPAPATRDPNPATGSVPAPATATAPALFSNDAFAMIPQDEVEIRDTTGIQRAQEIITQAGHLDSMAVSLADLLVGLLEYRDPFFRGGTSQTRLLATGIAKELGMNNEEVQAIALGTVLRDLGQVPLKGLISKPGTELGEEGRRRVENHV
ncbi:MAG: tetratricopeptide repeat protein, partial [Gemmatimonadota bacterium]